MAGVDVGVEQDGTITRVLHFPGLQVAEHAVARLPTSFPYVPGLLSFREIPALLQALAQLAIMPDLILLARCCGSS